MNRPKIIELITKAVEQLDEALVILDYAPYDEGDSELYDKLVSLSNQLETLIP
jgi:hypothetical protein